MAAESEQTTRPALGRCVACDRLLPCTNFREDASGRRGTWCETCRMDRSAKWGVEPDQVEAVYALYAEELKWKGEALATLRARIQAGLAPERDMAALQHHIAEYDRLRLTRIPERMRRFLAESRVAWYSRVGMVPAELARPEDVTP